MWILHRLFVQRFVSQFSVIMTNRGFRECFSWWVEKEDSSDTRSADFFVSVCSKRRKNVAQTASLSWHKINAPQFSNSYFCGLEIRKLIFESSVMEWRSNLPYSMNQSSVWPCQNISSVYSQGIENSKVSDLCNQTRTKVRLCLSQNSLLKQKLLWCGAGCSGGYFWAWGEGYGWYECSEMQQLRKAGIGKGFMGTDVFLACSVFPLIYVLWKSSWNQAVNHRHGTLLSKRIRFLPWSPILLKGCSLSQQRMQTGSTIGTETASAFNPTEEVFLSWSFRRKRYRRKK